MREGASAIRARSRSTSPRGAQDGGRAVDSRADVSWRSARDVFTLDALAWALASSRPDAGGIDAHGPGPRRRHRGRTPVRPCRRDRRRGRPSRRRRALGEQGAKRSASRCFPRSWGCSGGESLHHPEHEVTDNEETRPTRAAAGRCGGTPAVPGDRAERPATWMRRSSRWTMRRTRPTSMRSSRSDAAVKYLTTALAVYPHEEPGIGPNKYNFDDDVLYEIRVATGNDVAKGRTTYAYQFQFDTTYRNRNTILQSYLGVIGNVGDASQNLIQRYTVDQGRLAHRAHRRALGRGIVPPNNQGNATPRYNRNDDGEQPARDGVADEGDLDRLHGAVDRRARGRLHRLRRPAGRRVLCRRAGGLRSAEAAGARQGRGLAGRVQRPHHGAQHPDRRDRRRSADRRRLRDHQPPARQDSRSRSATRTAATSSRSRARATRSSTKASSRSRTRISTAAPRPKSTRRCSASTR